MNEYGAVTIPSGKIWMSEMELVELFGVIAPTIRATIKAVYKSLGLSVEVPSLGNLINDGRKVMMQAGLRYQLLYPTIILSFVTIAFYLIGNAFSDAADPKNHLQ